MTELFFTPHLTENEHWIFDQEYIDKYCEKHSGTSKKYYRKFKTGHVPMFRECKMVFKTKKDKFDFLQWCKDEYMDCSLNYHKEIKKAKTWDDHIKVDRGGKIE